MKKQEKRDVYCVEYHDKKALFIIHGNAKHDNQHDLCQKCYRKERNRQRISN